MALRDLLRNDELPVRLRRRSLVVGVDMVHLGFGLLDLLALFRELLRQLVVQPSPPLSHAR